MRLVTGITSMPSQQLQVRSDIGEQIRFTLNYRPAIQKWYMDLEYLKFRLCGYRICGGINILQKYFYALKWGLLVQIHDDFEPFLINDFASDRAKLYILSETECRELTKIYQELSDEI